MKAILPLFSQTPWLMNVFNDCVMSQIPLLQVLLIVGWTCSANTTYLSVDI